MRLHTGRRFRKAVADSLHKRKKALVDTQTVGSACDAQENNFEEELGVYSGLESNNCSFPDYDHHINSLEVAPFVNEFSKGPDKQKRSSTDLNHEAVASERSSFQSDGSSIVESERSLYTPDIQSQSEMQHFKATCLEADRSSVVEHDGDVAEVIDEINKILESQTFALDATLATSYGKNSYTTSSSDEGAAAHRMASDTTRTAQWCDSRKYCHFQSENMYFVLGKPEMSMKGANWDLKPAGIEQIKGLNVSAAESSRTRSMPDPLLAANNNVKEILIRELSRLGWLISYRRQILKRYSQVKHVSFQTYISICNWAIRTRKICSFSWNDLQATFKVCVYIIGAALQGRSMDKDASRSFARLKQEVKLVKWPSVWSVIFPVYGVRANAISLMKTKKYVAKTVLSAGLLYLFYAVALLGCSEVQLYEGFVLVLFCCWYRGIGHKKNVRAKQQSNQVEPVK